MSFSKIKALYAVAVLSLAVLLFVPDTLIRALAAIFLLLGAWPIWRTVVRGAASQALSNTLTLLEGAHHNQEDDRSFEDQPEDHRSAQ